MTGIYIITNQINNKVYIGQAGKGKNTIYKRLNGHYRDLINNKHGNKHLQFSWNKYGENAFTFDILEICQKDELDKKEIYWIDYYKSNNSSYGYNKDAGGSTGIPNKEAREKMSQKKKGNTNAKGSIRSDDYKEKQRQLHIGKILSEEHKRKISEGSKGKQHGPMSDEQKCKLSELNKGKNTGPNNYRWIETTEEMIVDVKNGMSRGKFNEKYGTRKPWERIRKMATI